jgi:hypothetical protein
MENGMMLIFAVIGLVVGARIAIWKHERALRRFYEWEAGGWREFAPLYEAGRRNIALMHLEAFERSSLVTHLNARLEPPANAEPTGVNRT